MIHEEHLSFDDRTILESPNFISAPSLGQISEGHCIIFPKHDVINLSKLSTCLHSELFDMATRLETALKTCYGPVVIFEHGAVEKCTEYSCGTDIAHLHLVPFDHQYIKEELDERFGPNKQHNSLPEFMKAGSKTDSPYILFGGLTEPCFEYQYGSVRESQAVRKVIWNKVRPSHSWDWRESPTPDLVNKVRDEVRAYL